MPLLIFRDSQGNQFDVEANVGDSVMFAATQAGIDGILAECGGACSCATCHAYVELERFRELPEASPHEQAMLEGVHEPSETSRLTCQIDVSDTMEGMIFTLPESQY